MIVLLIMDSHRHIDKGGIFINKRVFIKYGVITGALTLIISGTAIGMSMANAGDYEGDIIISNDPVGVYELCDHDENYVEPELKVGKYYYNGDTNAKYIEVTGDGMLYYRGGTAEDFVRDICGETEEEYQNAKSSDPEGIADEIEFFSTPSEYKVFTEHRLGDKIYVYERWSVDDTKDGEYHISGRGLTLEDENTLRRNYFTSYIYVE